MKLKTDLTFKNSIKILDQMIEHDGSSQLIQYYSSCTTSTNIKSMGLRGLDSIKENYIKIIQEIFDTEIERLKK